MIIERPNLNKADPMANIAMIDTWIARTADALNYEWGQLQTALAALYEQQESTEQGGSEIPEDAVTRAEFIAALANKADAAALANKVDKVTGKGLSTNDYTDADKTALANKVDKVTGKGLSTNDYTDADKAALAGKADQADLTTGLAGKVDKVTGKGLSTNDYTTAEKSKLSGIEAGAEVNVRSNWAQTDSTSDEYILNKPVIPAASSATPQANGTATAGSSADFSRADHVHPRDSFEADEINYVTPGATCTIAEALDELYEVAGGAPPSTTIPAMDGTASAGSEYKYSRGDHVHPTDTSRAPLASPTFTGTPAAPTAPAGTNTTQLATTAFVQDAVSGLDAADVSYLGTGTAGFTVDDALDELYDAVGGSTPSTTTPSMDGIAAVGTESAYARGDHVHPLSYSKTHTTTSSRRTQVTKYADGTMICGIWAKVTATVNTRWTYAYYGEVSLGSWPEAFAAEPIVTAAITARTGTNDAWVSLTGVTASSCGSAFIYRPASTNSANYEVNLIAFGRWK